MISAFSVLTIDPMFYIYILFPQSANKYYVGQTSDVQRRLEEHNNSIVNSKFTAKFTPWEIAVSFPVSDSRADAMKIEKFIKSQKSKKFILKLIENKNNSEFFQKLINNIVNAG